MACPVCTVLIIDDTAIDREQCRRFLLADISRTYQLLEAESVSTGLALCRSHSIDVILLDYALPDGNGLDFLAELSVQSQGKMPPVVMMTGQGNEKTAVSALKLGAEDYLVKGDMTPELLQLKVQRAIENSRLRQQQQQQTERFRASVANMLDCFGIYSAIRNAAGQLVDFRFDYLNAAAMQSNRMTEADMGKTLCELFPAVRTTGLLAEYCQVVETGIPLIKEDLIYTDVFAGELLTNAYSVQVAKVDDGMVVSWRDITAQKQVELSLIAANQQITTIWESMTDAYATLDPDWRVVYTNPAATEIYRQTTGLLPAQYLGENHWELFPATVGTIVEQEYRRAVADRVAINFEIFYPPTETWFEVHAYPSEVGLGVYFQNISERKQNELARIEAEQERDRFFKLSIDMLMVANFDGYFVRVNPACEKILGFTSAEIMAQPFLDFVHPDDRAATIAVYKELTAGNALVNFENRYRCQDGSYRWILWSAMPDADRNLIYASGHDITDRKRNEERLRQSEELNRLILESNRDCIKVIDLAGRVIYMNNPGQSLMEIDDFSTVAGSQWLEFWQGSERKLAQTAFSRALAGGVGRFDGYCPTNKGTPKWWEVIKTPILGADGQVSQVLSVSRDITDRQQAALLAQTQQATIQQQLGEIESIYRAAPIGLSYISSELKFIRINEQLAQINGLSIAAHIGLTIRDVLPEMADQIELLYRQVIESGEPIFDLEVSGIAPSQPGVERHWLASYYPQTDVCGRVVGVNAIVQEITDRKRDQAALEAHNRELEAFAYVVSHDLKAPLRAVANLSQWIEDDLEGQMTADTQSQITLLRSRIDRMAATIDGLLEYARCGYGEDAIETVAVAQLLADVIDSVAPPPTFAIKLPAELPTFLTKRLPLFQVFSNLIGNGIKHHHSEAGSIQVAIAERGSFYEFAIVDDGPGIDPEHQARMFKIFQAVNPQSRSDSTGIGLAIVKKIIEAEGGTIWLESEIGQGTTFYFTWPKRSDDPKNVKH
jgi:PAS domain S-box-containing protein